MNQNPSKHGRKAALVEQSDSKGLGFFLLIHSAILEGALNSSIVIIFFSLFSPETIFFLEFQAAIHLRYSLFLLVAGEIMIKNK